MFQTKLDRWLIEKFVYEHHILVTTLPSKLPFGVKKEELPAATRSGYKFRLEISNPNTAEKVLENLRDEGRAFKTQIIEKSHWYNWLLNNKRKSFTFRIFWWAVFAFFLFFGISKLSRFSKTEQFAEIKSQIQKVLDSSR